MGSCRNRELRFGIVASLISTFREFSKCGSSLGAREKMIIAGPALLKAYAALTRLPPPHRTAPETALTLLESNFLKPGSVVALNAKSYATLLRYAPATAVAGGRVYDAVIGACAEQGKASTVLTFNAGDFTGLGKSFAVVIPGSV